MENKKNKYANQIIHLRKNYKSFHIDFRNEDFDKFVEICKRRKTTPTTEIRRFVENYIRNED